MCRPRRVKHCVALLTVVLLGACAPADPGTSALPPSTAASTAATPSSTAVASPTAEPTIPPARWSDCGRGFTCAEIRVPRDYAAPHEGYLNVALIRAAATDPTGRIGSLLVNPGGPGASGVDMVRNDELGLAEEVRERFDIIGFDPRGVNSSTAIRCLDNLDGHDALDPSPDDTAELDALIDAARLYAEACGSRNDTTLAYLSTDAVVQDLDMIRAAVGDEKLTYLGFSYGTLIGALYAERYPDRIRALALDGAIDPSLDLRALRAGQATAFEGALARFLDDCAGRPDCAFHEGGRPARAFDRLMASIDAEPIPAPHLADGRLVGPGLASYAVLAALYSESYWPVLELALASAKLGDGSIMLAIADPFRGRKPNGSYSNLQDAYTANTCLDFPAPTELADYTAWATDFEAGSPHFAQLIAYNDLPCAFWPVPAQRVPQGVSAPDAPPIVVVGTTGDPATPYAWAEALVDQLKSAVLVTYEGEGHTAYLASPCVLKVINGYLLELTVPKDGLTCD